MMSVSEYALDVDKSVNAILNLCKKLELSIKTICYLMMISLC